MSSYYARRPLQSSGCSNSDSCWDGAPIEITESGPSVAGRLAALASRMTIKPLMTVGSYLSPLPLPLGFVDFACRVWRPGQGTVRTTINLPNATAQLVRAPGVRAADGAGRVVLYLHGGAFVMCGPNSHSRIVNALSGFAESPVLIVDYRLIPKHSLGMALDDCHDAYQWLRARGYRPEQIVLAGDSAGGYLALALAQRLQCDDEKPAAIVAISPLLQLAKGPKQDHPNIGTDAMFPARAFDALAAWVRAAAAKNMVDGRPEDLYEPLDHIESSLPPTLIHVSGSEVLLHDAQLGGGWIVAECTGELYLRACARCGHRLVGALPAWRSGQRRRKHRLAGARKRVHHERQVHVHAAYHAHPGRHGADVSLTGVCHACCWLKSLVSLLSQGYQWVSCRWRVPVFEHACGSGRVVGMLDRLDAVGRWSECVVV